MKQFALSLALLSAASIISAAKFEVELTHNGKTVDKVLDLDVAKELTIQSDEISAQLQFTVQEDNSVLVAATVTERKQDGTEVVVHDGAVVTLTLDSANSSIANAEEHSACTAAEGQSVLTVRVLND